MISVNLPHVAQCSKSKVDTNKPLNKWDSEQEQYLHWTYQAELPEARPNSRGEEKRPELLIGVW